jgi:hypothetical protein
MTHKQKVAHFKQLLRDRGYWRSNAIPPACQLLWLLGFETPPPYFLPFWTGVVVAGVPYGCLMGLFMGVVPHFIYWFLGGGNIIAGFSVLLTIFAIFIGSISGLGFGLIMALFSQRQARKLQLPDWADFPSPKNPPFL